jgi:hypothetical protein
MRRGHHRELAAGHVAAHRLHGDVLVAEDHARQGSTSISVIDCALRLGEAADLVLGERISSMSRVPRPSLHRVASISDSSRTAACPALRRRNAAHPRRRVAFESNFSMRQFGGAHGRIAARPVGDIGNMRSDDPARSPTARHLGFVRNRDLRRAYRRSGALTSRAPVSPRWPCRVSAAGHRHGPPGCQVRTEQNAFSGPTPHPFTAPRSAR